MLLLDNFEQVVSAAPLIAELLTDCRWLRVLVTSRATLQVRAERQYRVPPLTVPDPANLPAVEILARTPAVALFVDRAERASPEFALSAENAPAVAAICARLEGLPLAIELVASRLAQFSPQELQSSLHHRLPLLTGGPRDLPARQQTLRDAIAWSYHLLSREEQNLFAQLGVFVGGWTRAMAERVTNCAGRRSAHAS